MVAQHGVVGDLHVCVGHRGEVAGFLRGVGPGGVLFFGPSNGVVAVLVGQGGGFGGGTFRRVRVAGHFHHVHHGPFVLVGGGHVGLGCLVSDVGALLAPGFRRGGQGFQSVRVYPGKPLVGVGQVVPNVQQLVKIRIPFRTRGVGVVLRVRRPCFGFHHQQLQRMFPAPSIGRAFPCRSRRLHRHVRHPRRPAGFGFRHHVHVAFVPGQPRVKLAQFLNGFRMKMVTNGPCSVFFFLVHVQHGFAVGKGQRQQFGLFRHHIGIGHFAASRGRHCHGLFPSVLVFHRYVRRRRVGVPHHSLAKPSLVHHTLVTLQGRHAIRLDFARRQHPVRHIDLPVQITGVRVGLLLRHPRVLHREVGHVLRHRGVGHQGLNRRQRGLPGRQGRRRPGQQ